MFDELYKIKTRKNLRIYSIVATDTNGCIGKDNLIPWNVPSDMKRFRYLTKNHTVIMGRKTHESIGKLLPNRLNLVVSRTEHVNEPGSELIWCRDLESALEKSAPNKVVWICGGAEIYKAMAPLVDVVHHTLVDTSVLDGDTQIKGELPYFSHVPIGWVHVKNELMKASDDQFRSCYMVHARTEAILKHIGLDING